MRIIGAADEFWRLRLTHVGTTGDLDFEWHDDILYREPEPETAEELDLWSVEAVSLGEDEAVVCIAGFEERDDAEEFLGAVGDDLREMTKTQFEEAYLAKDAGPELDDEAPLA